MTSPPAGSRDAPRPSGRGERALRVGAGAATALLAAFAFRALAGFDPTQISRFDAPPSEAAFFSPTGNAPFFVYAVALWLLYERRARFFASLGGPASRAISLCALVGAVAAAALAAHADAPDLLLPAASLAAIALAAALGGRPAVRAAWIPAAALVALVPVPAALVNHVVLPLQLATADATAALLRAIGMEAVAVADRIVVGGEQVFQVIESCSGLRATQTIALSALLYGAIFERPRAHWALLVALAPPLGLVVNELRVLSLVFNPYSSFASVHEAQGLAMLVVGVLAIAAVDALLVRALPTGAHASRAARATARRARAHSPRAPIGAARAFACAGGAAALALASLVPPSANADAALAWDPSDVPIRLAGFRSQPRRLDRVYMGSTRFRADTNRVFARDGDEVAVYLGVLPRSARTASVLSPKIAPLGTARRSEPDPSFVDPDAARGARAFLVATADGVERVLVWTRGTCSLGCEAARSALALDRSALARDDMPYVARLATLVGPHAVDVARADARLVAFADSLEGSLARVEERAAARAAARARRDAARRARR